MKPFACVDCGATKEGAELIYDLNPEGKLVMYVLCDHHYCMRVAEDNKKNLY